MFRPMELIRRPPPSPTDTPLCRIGFLCARFFRQPFSMQITEHYCRLDRLPMMMRLDMENILPLGGGSHPLYIAYFPAVCSTTSNLDGSTNEKDGTQTPKRFLRIDDPDITRLLRRNEDDWRELAPRYFLLTNEIRRDANLVASLANAIGKTEHEWTPQEDEIHLIALVVHKRFRIAVWPKLTHSVPDWFAPRSHYSFGSNTDRWFHSPQACLPIQTQLVAVLDHATQSNWAFSTLPEFDRVVFRRRRCQYMSKRKGGPLTRVNTSGFSSVGTAQASPPSLVQLTEDAALDTLLSHPPQCVGPVDCVIDASLYHSTTDSVVLGNVLCFVKFDRIEPDPYNTRWGHYVNPTMLNTLNQVALAADPFRPRLLVFARTMRNIDVCVQRECLPTTFPSVMVSWI